MDTGLTTNENIKFNQSIPILSVNDETLNVVNIMYESTIYFFFFLFFTLS